MASIQTLSDDDRRALSTWAVDCAERVRPLFISDATAESVVDDAIDRARRYAAGHRSAAEEITLRMAVVKIAGTATTMAGAAAARAVAQASGVAHMGAHALGAAGYAAKAVSLADPRNTTAVDDEIAWQLAHLTDSQRAALRRLPDLGSNSSGPLGPGLLTQGVVGAAI